MRVLQKGKHVWSGLQTSEAHCKHIVTTKHSEGEQIHWPCNKWGQGVKAKIPFHCKPPMEMVFFHCVEYTLQFANFNPLVLCHLWDCYWLLITLASLSAAFPHLGIEKDFLTNQGSQERRAQFEWVSFYWIPLQRAIAHRVCGSRAVPWPYYWWGLVWIKEKVTYLQTTNGAGFYFIFLPFLGLLPWHMEVYRLGV